MNDDEYEVIIARHGTREGLRSEAYLNFPLYGEDDSSITTDYYVWIARNAERTVFIDTGFAEDSARRRGRTVLHRLPELYASLGVDPAAGWPVVLTHAHWDHIGNLDLFPHSRFWIARAEVDFWQTDVSQATVIAHYVEERELSALQRLRRAGRLEIFDESSQVAPGIVVSRTGGHTPGQSMVTVTTREGAVLLTSDAVHFAEELELERPFTAVTDLPGIFDGFARVKAFAASVGAAHVVTGHDADALEAGERRGVDHSVIAPLPRG